MINPTISQDHASVKTFAAVGLLASVVITGCATADFTAYSGAQQNWPTDPGVFVKTQYAVPAYSGLLSRPYSVLGYLKADIAPVRRKRVVEFAAPRAKEIGADAIILQNVGSEYQGTIATSGASTTRSYSGSGYSTLMGNGALGTFSGTGQSTTQTDCFILDAAWPPRTVTKQRRVRDGKKLRLLERADWASCGSEFPPSHSVASFSFVLPGPANPRSLRGFSSFRRWPPPARPVLSS